MRIDAYSKNREGPVILTLCGSTRFEKQFHLWNKRLSLSGHVVLSLSVFPSNEDGRDWFTPLEKEMVDRVHLKKIDLSDAIVVLNIDNYIGESTRREIEHAIKMGKSVYAVCPLDTTASTEAYTLLSGG